MKVTFRAKVKECYFTDGTLARRYIKVPKVTSAHYDVSEARIHPRYGNMANWDGFPSVVQGAMLKSGVRKDAAGMWVELGPVAELPAGITVDETGFLAVVTVDIG
jgi:hypothetical protein